MFSRAAKSIVKSIGQRNYHAGEETIKVAISGSAGEVGRSLSPMLKQSSRLDALALHDVPASKRYSSMPARFLSFSDGESANPIISRMLTMIDKSRYPVKDGQRSEGMQKSISYSSRQPSKDAKKETDELVEALHRLPIAEEAAADQPTKSKVVASQGDNAYTSEQRGPRVLGEMGPSDNFRHDGRIVSEIYKQFPNLATCFGKNSSKTMNRATWRQLSSFPTRSFSTTRNVRKRLNDVLPGSESNSSKYTDEFLLAKNNSMRKKIKKRGPSEKTNADKLTASSEYAVGENHLEGIEDARSAPMEKPEKGRIRDSKSKAWKTVEGTTVKVEKRTTNLGKPQNWSIPAVLLDKKPKLLYGLVQRRQTPTSWFFSKLLDAQNTDAIAATRSNRYRGLVSEAGKFGSVQDQRVLEEPKTRDEGRLNASTSTTSLGFPEKVEGDSRSPKETDRCTRRDPDVADKKTPSRSSSVGSESETISETSTSRNPLRNASSKIALFLENLRTSRRKSRSLSSLTSYNLDSLFAPREAAQVAFFSSSSAKFGLKDKFTKKFGGKKKTESCKKQQQPSCKSRKKEPADCKKRDDDGSKQKCRSSCGDGANDPCKSLVSKHYGSRCKEYEPDKEYSSSEDPCKKYRREEIYGKSCKNGDDACKKHRKEEIYGKICKEYRSEAGSEDLYDKYWRDDIYGPRCNKRKQKKADLCNREKTSSCSTGKKATSCTTEKKPTSCTTEKKPTSCKTEKKPTSCTTVNKPVSCTTVNKPVSCTTEKKPTSCTTEKKPTSCTTEKRPTSCKTEKKPTSCTTEKRPTSCKTEKKPTSCTTEKKPTSCTTEKKPTSCTTVNKPVSCTTEKKPTSCTTEKKTTTCTTEKKPTTCTTEKKPTTCTTEKKPTTCTTEKKPTTCTTEKKPTSCTTEKKPASCTTEKKPTSCTTEKKPTSCTTEKKPTSCTTEKKPASCTTEKKPTSCTTEKKPTSCTTEKRPTSCTTEKRPTSCTTEKKPSTCSTAKAARSCSTIEKARSCDRDADPCGDGKKKKKKKKEQKPKDCCTKKKKKECPPVFRAPGCPKNSGKSGGSGSPPC